MGTQETFGMIASIVFVLSILVFVDRVILSSYVVQSSLPSGSFASSSPRIEGVPSVSGAESECVYDNDCDDGFFCTGVEYCVSGRCENNPLVVSDDISCTVDQCNEDEDSFEYIPDCVAGEYCDRDGGCVPLPTVSDQVVSDGESVVTEDASLEGEEFAVHGLSSSCVELWRCVVLGGCENDRQRYSCEDLYECGTNYARPAGFVACTSQSLAGRVGHSPFEQEQISFGRVIFVFLFVFLIGSSVVVLILFVLLEREKQRVVRTIS